MLRELSEEVRILVKDRLRDLRSMVRQHRHDQTERKIPDAKDQPFPIREIEGLLGHAASAFDDVMTLAESFAPRGTPVPGPKPLQSYFRARGEPSVDGERAFRRDLYRLAKLALEQKGLHDFRILESDFAAVHDSLEKDAAAPIAELHAEAGRAQRVSLVATLSALLFLELLRRHPIRFPPPEAGDDRPANPGANAAPDVLASIAIASGLATLDMEGAPGAELMEIAILAVDARGDRIRAALDGENALAELTPLFESLLTHLN